jgi:hypothetical protein
VQGRLSARVAICGGDDLRAAAATLGLESCDSGRPDVVLVDLRDAAACAAAAALEPAVPRVAVAGENERALAAALGFDVAKVATTCEPAALGPLVVAALPRTPRRATRLIVITAPRGGTGCTLLAANLSRRLAPRIGVVSVDATGTGALGWWLGCTPRAWTELEGLTDELSAEHLAVVATDSAGLRVLGGAPVAPTRALAESTVRAAASLADLVIVDAPALADERARALAILADRVMVLSYDDPLSIATLDASEIPSGAWLLASQSRASRIGERAAFRALPRDESAVSGVLSGRGPVGGTLGRVYDELAELIALDAS